MPDTTPDKQTLGTGALWALGAIVLIATVYEVNKKIGLGLFVLALMAMVYTYVKNNNISFERPV